MGEKSRGSSEFGGRRFERLKTPEQISGCLTEIDRLLGQLLEGGIEWDAQVRRMRRKAILNLMQSIGIRSFDDLEGFTKAHEAARSFWDTLFSKAAWDKTPQGFSDPKGYFAALEIDAESLNGKTEAEVKTLLRKHYWKLAKEYHPDSNPGDEVAAEQMKMINIAYSVLSDPKKREDYLQSG